jgi:glycosyltransferase involved in cell wall biosynthesis
MQRSRVREDNSRATWLCCQLGAREHYAIPRALHRRHQLAHLVTDAWVPPQSAFRALPGGRARRLCERYQEELARVPITHFTSSLIGHELRWRAQSLTGWQLFMARNLWFQERAARVLRSSPAGPAMVVFAHSYAALEIFRAARQRSYRCVLAQIDPGERHFALVAESARQAPEYGPAPPAPPARYLEAWREECALADHIVVNSEWSLDSLQHAGVPASKMTVVPLAYDGEGTVSDVHAYPDRFTIERPLRLLYVGQVSVAKGVKVLFDSMALLGDAPVELTVVGERSAQVPLQHLNDQRIRWIGPVSRSEVMSHYRVADALIFPSLSDGFGMAQIEARGWRLPIVASRSSGQVVDDGVNGILLDEVTPEALAAVIKRLIAGPQLLARFSHNSISAPSTGLDALGDSLLCLEAVR